MLTMGVSMNCGFVGGFLFPTLVIANIAGVLAFRIINPDGNDPDYPLGFFLSTFLAAVPGAFAPMPLTLILLPTTVFFLGLEQVQHHMCFMYFHCHVCLPACLTPPLTARTPNSIPFFQSWHPSSWQ
jgi:hypothetical protein